MYKIIIFRNATALGKLPYRNLLHTPKHLRSISSSSGIILPYTPLTLKYDVTIRNMSKKDLQLALKWAEDEGWNPGKHEVEPLYAADPSGYYILEVDGEPTASLAAVRHSQTVAFLGLFIVIPKRRHEGFGAMLWDAVVTHNLKICSSVGLNAVMTQVERYGKSGFYPSFLNTRWKGSPDNIPGEKGIKKEELILTDKLSTKDLIECNSKIFSATKKVFLAEWLKMPELHALAVLNKKGDIMGFGAISRTVREKSFKIAPLYARSEAAADQLYRGLCSFAGKDATVSIDISENNPYVSTMVERFKLAKVFDTMRMYKGETQEIDKDMVGSTSLEIGK